MNKERLKEVNKIIEKCIEEQNKTLHLAGFEIKNLNDIPLILECVHIEKLYLEGGRNGLSSIKELGSFFPNLLELDLRFNSITKIEGLENLSNLQLLHMGGNSITRIEGLESLSNLQKLFLYGNSISKIRGLENLSNLQTLSLHENNIIKIEGLDKLESIQVLSLYGNSITKIEALESLTSLQYLYLNGNLIGRIEGLEGLINLQGLNLNNNVIKKVEGLDRFTNLRLLGLQDNYLSKLPYDILSLNLRLTVEKENEAAMPRDRREVLLYGNPLVSPSPEVIKLGLSAIQNWFLANKKRLNEVKVILIGEPKAGKTSLLKRLYFNEFDEKEEQTDGINIESIRFGEVEAFQGYESLHNITGHFWDFGGQEIMNNTHQFFLTKRSVYMLLLDARKDQDVLRQTREWMERILATGGSSPVIVVANKLDLNAGFGFENEYELQKEFPQIKKFINVSCFDSTNLDQLKSLLEKIIPETPLFNTEIDERWIEIKEELSQELEAKAQEGKYLDERKFIEICESKDIFEKEEQRNVISFLHDLGLLLHFEEVDENYFILDPYWITYGVYQILTSRMAGNRKGKISNSDLEFIINEEEDKEMTYQVKNFQKIRYYSKDREFLMKILCRFKLAYYERESESYIIPDLLETQEPTMHTLAIREAKENIQFIYQYTYLPKSVMPYIMVEAHNILSYEWRTGCMLSYKESQALILQYGSRLSIIVIGDHKQKREFMSVLKHLVGKINSKLDLSPKELIPLPDDSDFVSYKMLLQMERKGKRYYDVYEPEYKEYQISQLLEGIEDSVNDEISMHQIDKKLDLALKKYDETYRKLEEIHTDMFIRLKSQEALLRVKLGFPGEDGELARVINNTSEQFALDTVEGVLDYIDNTEIEVDSKLEGVISEIKSERLKPKKAGVDKYISAKFNLLALLGYFVGIDPVILTLLGSSFDIKEALMDRFEKLKRR